LLLARRDPCRTGSTGMPPMHAALPEFLSPHNRHHGSEKRWRAMVDTAGRIERQVFGRPGWMRILRTTLVGFVIQAGSRMAAALGAPGRPAGGRSWPLPITLGAFLRGGGPPREIAASALPRLLPPSAGIAPARAEGAVRHSSPSTGLAIVTGLISLIG